MGRCWREDERRVDMARPKAFDGEILFCFFIFGYICKRTIKETL